MLVLATYVPASSSGCSRRPRSSPSPAAHDNNNKGTHKRAHVKGSSERAVGIEGLGTCSFLSSSRGLMTLDLVRFRASFSTSLSDRSRSPSFLPPPPGPSFSPPNGFLLHTPHHITPHHTTPHHRRHKDRQREKGQLRAAHCARKGQSRLRESGHIPEGGIEGGQGRLHFQLLALSLKPLRLFRLLVRLRASNRNVPTTTRREKRRER